MRKLIVEIDLDKIEAAEPNDIGAAEGLAAAMLHRAAGKVIKDGWPAEDGLAFALMHDGEQLGKMSQIDVEDVHQLAAAATALYVDAIERNETISEETGEEYDDFKRLREALGFDLEESEGDAE